jgi:excisionase family DNA binding protein
MSDDLDRGTVLTRELYAPREAQHILSVSHAQLYRLIGRGRLDAVKIGRSTYITRSSIRRFLTELPRAVIGSTGDART